MSDEILIYIGNLPLSVDQKFITSFIKGIGVDAIDIVLKTRKNCESKFAFVKFQLMEDAKKVIDELNYTKLDSRTIRMSLVNSETKRLTETNEGNLFIKKLDPSVEISQLHEAFSKYGEIISCFIPQTDGKPHGYGFVQFRNKDDAEQAMDDLDDSTFNGKQIEIHKYSKQTKKSIEEVFTSVYAKDFPQHYTADEVKNLFSQFGSIRDVYCKQNIVNGQILPYAFINFNRHEDAVAAIESLHEKQIDGKALYVQRVQSRNERQIELNKQHEKMKQLRRKETRRRNLLVSGLSADFTTEQFKEVFSRFGEIESCVVMTGSNPLRGSKYGFVCFKRDEDAAECIKQVTANCFLSHGNRALYVSYVRARKDHEKAPGVEWNEWLEDNFYGLRNFKTELIKKINEKCVASDAKKLIRYLDSCSLDQARLIALDEAIFQSWKARCLGRN